MVIRFLQRNFQSIKDNFLFFYKKVRKFFRKTIKISKYYVKKYFKKLNKERIRIYEEYPELIETFQLITIYLFAIITYTKYLKSVFRVYPKVVKLLVPFCQVLGELPIFFFLGHVNYSYIFYTVINQLLYRRRIIHFSPRIRFHILYIMLLEILQSVTFEWIAFFFKTDKKTMRPMLETLFSMNFLFFYFVYIYSFIMGLKNRLPYFPPFLQFLNLITDSALFWIGLAKVKK